MLTFHFKNFLGTLDIQAPHYDGDIPVNSPVHIFYKENSNLSKHEILKRFYKILKDNHITYLYPKNNLTEEWMFNLKEFKRSFKCLKDINYLQGSITIEPFYTSTKIKSEYDEEKLTYSTSIKISITHDDLPLLQSSPSILSQNLSLPLKKFKKDYPNTNICGFLMMKFEDSPIQKEIVKVLKSHLSDKGITLLRADEKWYADDLFENIKTYMEGCSFGIALFDRVNTEEFNPNVSLEIGYMMALNKPVLLLKDKTLKSLPSDLVGKLYHQFDFQDPEKTIPIVLDKWISDKEL